MPSSIPILGALVFDRLVAYWALVRFVICEVCQVGRQLNRGRRVVFFRLERLEIAEVIEEAVETFGTVEFLFCPKCPFKAYPNQ
jgi:hypothetical protein